MILAFITSIGAFEVADYESSITFLKSKTADPIWRPDRKKNLYSIYDLIRAVFFQNLNVYLRKTCKIVLLKVLPI